MDTVVALVLVALAALYVGRRAWRTVAGKPCGCGASAERCPAAGDLARDLERIARDVPGS